MAGLEQNLIEFTAPGQTSAEKIPAGVALLDSPEGLGEFEELCWHHLHIFPPAISLGQIRTYYLDENYQPMDRKPTPGERFSLEFDSRIFYQGHPVGQIMVSLYRPKNGAADEIYLELEQGQIWDAELRGRGLGKAIANNVIALGRALGTHSITLFAMYDGRFVWAALGFKFGDYLPENRITTRFRRSFRAYCLRQGITPPDTRNWDAGDFARFKAGKTLPARVGHKHDQRLEQVEVGRAFMLSRRPFFLCYPLKVSN